jgi:hypothetical protein
VLVIGADVDGLARALCDRARRRFALPVVHASNGDRGRRRPELGAPTHGTG